MFIVLLTFSTNRAMAKQYMEEHNEWLKRGFDAGVFALAGSLSAGAGGAILAHDTTLAELQSRVEQDPFVAQAIVRAEIVEVTPSKTDPRLAFMSAA